MTEAFLNYPIKRYLCPFCGEWHEPRNCNQKLAYYNHELRQAEFRCDTFDRYCIYFPNNWLLHYYIYAPCARTVLRLEGNVAISSIEESSELPRVTFDVENDVGNVQCYYCSYKHRRTVCRLGQQGDHRHMKLSLGFEFDQEEFNIIIEMKSILAKQSEYLMEKQDRDNAAILSFMADVGESPIANSEMRHYLMLKDFMDYMSKIPEQTDGETVE